MYLPSLRINQLWQLGSLSTLLNYLPSTVPTYAKEKGLSALFDRPSTPYIISQHIQSIVVQR